MWHHRSALALSVLCVAWRFAGVSGQSAFDTSFQRRSEGDTFLTDVNGTWCPLEAPLAVFIHAPLSSCRVLPAFLWRQGVCLGFVPASCRLPSPAQLLAAPWCTGSWGMDCSGIFCVGRSCPFGGVPPGGSPVLRTCRPAVAALPHGSGWGRQLQCRRQPLQRIQHLPALSREPCTAPGWRRLVGAAQHLWVHAGSAGALGLRPASTLLCVQTLEPRACSVRPWPSVRFRLWLHCQGPGRRPGTASRAAGA